MQQLLSIHSPQLKYTGVALTIGQRILTLPVGITSIIGPNGAGKSAFANIIENGWNYMTNHLSSPSGRRPRVRTLAFSNLHSLTGFKVEYYQQRFESMMNDDVPTVAELLGEAAQTPQWQQWSARLGLDRCLDKKTNYLSSGELRKLLIANAMMDLPEILVLDNPYIGLDAIARRVVEDAIAAIARDGASVLMLVCDPEDIHPRSSAILPLSNLTVHPPIISVPGPSATGQSLSSLFDFGYDRAALAELMSINRPGGTGFFTEQSDYVDCQSVWPPADEPAHPCASTPIVELHHCCVRYGKKVLIDDIDWTILPGECWSLSGPNGSGKSTLLSLINADNPQAYSNDVRLFGVRRGSGESIWDIKRRIGFLSAESHLYFRGYNDSVERILSRAAKDDPSDFGPLSPRQRSIVDLWLRTFRIETWTDRLFRQLSFGQQRLVLLVAALVKMPSLLILDEPLHGLDRGVKRAVIDIIDRLASTGMTLIYVTHNPAELPRCITHTKSLTL